MTERACRCCGGPFVAGTYAMRCGPCQSAMSAKEHEDWSVAEEAEWMRSQGPRRRARLLAALDRRAVCLCSAQPWQAGPMRVLIEALVVSPARKRRR